MAPPCSIFTNCNRVPLSGMQWLQPHPASSSSYSVLPHEPDRIRIDPMARAGVVYLIASSGLSTDNTQHLD